jgi:hypothetical protein
VSHEASLLAASFLRGERAVAAWEAWHPAVDIEALPPESQALLPQLYRNLTNQGVEHPLLLRIAGVYRHAWYANQRLLACAVEAVRALGAAGIETQLVGGSALALTCYADSGARRLQAAELLVDGRAVLRAAIVLRRAGWRDTRGAAQGALRLAVRGRTLLRSDTRELLMLRRGPLPGGPERGHTLEVHGVEVRVPPLAVQLADARRRSAGRQADVWGRGDVFAAVCAVRR